MIEAFGKMPSRRLVVVGEGQQSDVLRKLAGPNVTFTGYLDDAAYRRVVGEARALVFAGCEDFGIALAEAQACGTPVIAFGRGGATDIVQPLGKSDAPTGVLFKKQTTDDISAAIALFEANAGEILPSVCRENAMRFEPSRFKSEFARAFEDATLINARRMA